LKAAEDLSLSDDPEVPEVQRAVDTNNKVVSSVFKCHTFMDHIERNGHLFEQMNGLEFGSGR
jgi:hypothetical protein